MPTFMHPCLTAEQKTTIRKNLHRDVGKHVISATQSKGNCKEIRRVSDRTLQRTVHRLGNAYLYRTGKPAISDKYKPSHLKYCDWLLKQDRSVLNTFACVHLFFPTED